MTNTTFSIELQGLNLPDDVKNKLESGLRSVALAEIAKIDLGKGLSVEPLPRSSERSIGQIFGYVIKNVGKATERGGVLVWPGLPSTPPDSGTPLTLPIDGFPSVDAIESLYYRPDIRTASVSNSRALAELFSRDEQALQEFNNLTGGGADAPAETERYAALAAVALVAIGVGIAAGYVVNRQK